MVWGRSDVRRRRRGRGFWREWDRVGGSGLILFINFFFIFWFVIILYKYKI